MSSNSLFKRYVNGDCLAVIQHLQSLGEAVRLSPHDSYAIDVAKEFVDRAISNLVTIKSRLEQIGYQFENPANSLRLHKEAPIELLNEIESTLGALPVILRCWYERVDCVDFSQAERQWKCDCHEPPSGTPAHFGLGMSGNGLDIWPPRKAFAAGIGSKPQIEILAKRISERVRNNEVDVFGEPYEMLEYTASLTIGLFNCSEYGPTLPAHGFDEICYDDGKALSFSELIRHAFLGGGFPYWMSQFDDPDQYYMPYRYRPDLPHLFEYLTEGLREL